MASVLSLPPMVDTRHQQAPSSRHQRTAAGGDKDLYDEVFDELLFDAPCFGDPILNSGDDGDPPVEYPLGVPTDDGLGFGTPPVDAAFLTPPSSPPWCHGERVTPPSTPGGEAYRDARRDVLRAVSWDGDAGAWNEAAPVATGRARAVSYGAPSDYSPWPAAGDAVYVPYDDLAQGGLTWHKGYVVAGGGSLLQVSFTRGAVETVAVNSCRREPPLGARTYAAPDVGVDAYEDAILDRRLRLDRKRKVPCGRGRGPFASSPAESPKKAGRKNGALSEARWAAEREKARDPTMPAKRPVGISLASGSSSGWRLRISGTQLGHYATAQQAWAAYPRETMRAKASVEDPPRSPPRSPRAPAEAVDDDAAAAL